MPTSPTDTVAVPVAVPIKEEDSAVEHPCEHCGVNEAAHDSHLCPECRSGSERA